MNRNTLKLLTWIAVGLLSTGAVLVFLAYVPISADSRILSYVADPRKQDIRLYWKDDRGNILESIWNLKRLTGSRRQDLVFAMNGGMFDPRYRPIGLYIEEGKKLRRLNRSRGGGNFHLRPNGVFYLTRDNRAVVCQTSEFVNHPSVRFATQSGPMLVVNGRIHPAFRKGSASRKIRNGVGILPDGRVLFAISKSGISLHDFATYFRRAGCRNALYLDGGISNAYLPEKFRVLAFGSFGVMIGVTERR